VAAVCIEAAAVLVLSADREAAARFGDRWAVAQHADRPAEPLCVGRWAVVPLWVRAEVLPYADGWAVAPLWVRPEVPQSAGRWVVALPWGRPAMLPCVGLRATSRSVVLGHIRTYIAGRIPTFTVAPIPIMEPVLSRQVLSPALLLVPQQPPHTTTPITRSPIIRLPVDRHIRRTRPPAQTPIEMIVVSAER
jgi:hypothetical protein